MKSTRLIINVLRSDGSWDIRNETTFKTVPGQIVRIILNVDIMTGLSKSESKMIKIQDIRFAFTTEPEHLLAMVFTHKGMGLKTGWEIVNNNLIVRNDKIVFCGVESRIQGFAIDLIDTNKSFSKF